MAKPKKISMLTAVFRNRANANAAYDRLIARGYSNAEINVLMSDTTRSEFAQSDDDERHDAETLATEGVGVGSAIGAAVGAGLAAAAAIGTTLAIPGLGVVVAGPVAAALAGSGAGAVTGGLIGGLVGLGMTESNAKAYHEALREGGVVVGVVPRDKNDASSIEEEFEELGGENICFC